MLVAAAAQLGRPEETERTWPAEPMASFESVLVARHKGCPR